MFKKVNIISIFNDKIIIIIKKAILNNIIMINKTIYVTLHIIVFFLNK